MQWTDKLTNLPTSIIHEIKLLLHESITMLKICQAVDIPFTVATMAKHETLDQIMPA